MKKVTISDIAKAAGLTKGAISMVLNDYKRIPQATKERIRKIMKDMDYIPNESAQSLARGKSKNIAFIAVRFAAPFISNILNSFEQRAFDLNKYVHGIVPYSTHNEESTKNDFLKRILEDRKAEAVVMLTMRPRREILASYNRAGIPIILIENTMKGAHSIIVDNYAGASAAAMHLLASGRKNIGIITRTPPKKGIETANNLPAIDRLNGFRETLLKHGHKLVDNNIEVVRAYKFEDGMKGLENFMIKGAKLDAVFCAAGDMVAMGVLEKARELGIRVPDDLAVIGFDDVLAARFIKPALTTVRQPIEQMGQMAFDITIEAIGGELINEKHIKVTPELIVRESA